MQKDDIEELMEWKHKQELKEAEKTGQWKTCALAWSIITFFVGAIAAAIAQCSNAVYAGLKAFWVVVWGGNQ